MSAAIGNKRKRRVSSTNITLNNLSNDILCSVADYLPKTSRVLLAVAFTAPSSSWKKYQWKGKPSTSSKAIISSVKDDTPCKSLMADLLSELDVEMNRRELRERNSYRNYKPEVKKFRNDDLKKVIKSGLDQQMSTYYDGGWEILDFVDVPKSLAARLTDDDLAAILVCIDAKNNLKRLNLTHCFSIVGQGLETLRGSTVLEKLDLGLVRQMEVPQLFTDAQISGEVVYDILNGILEVEGNAFRRLQVPVAWCNEGENNTSPSERLTHFIDGHDLAFMNKRNLCAYFGYANLQSVLSKLAEDEHNDAIDKCTKCYWSDEFHTCSHCNEIQCLNCNHDVSFCGGQDYECGIVSCEDCRDEKVENSVQYCDNEWCENNRCHECLWTECCNGTIDCEDCKAKVFDRLIAENDEKQREIEKLQRQLSKLQCGM